LFSVICGVFNKSIIPEDEKDVRRLSDDEVVVSSANKNV
jgi:hypothetical protein